MKIDREVYYLIKVGDMFVCANNFRETVLTDSEEKAIEGVYGKSKETSFNHTEEIENGIIRTYKELSNKGVNARIVQKTISTEVSEHLMVISNDFSGNLRLTRQ